MQRTTRRIGTVLATGLAAAGLATAGSATAATPAQSASATGVTSGPFTLSFQAQRAAEAPQTAATGTFDATMKIGGIGLMDIHGPVTCLNVRGNRVGLFYPIKTGNPALLTQIGSGVMVYMTVDGKGRASRVSFLPLPLTSVKSCAPTAAEFLPASGMASLTS